MKIHFCLHKLRALVLILVALNLANATTGWSGARARANPNATVIHDLFNTPLPEIQNPAKHTFVFWINGDQDHSHPASSIPSNLRDTSPHLYRADSIEVTHILKV